jgi:hypothetical protein
MTKTFFEELREKKEESIDYQATINRLSRALIRLIAKNGELEDENEMLKKQLREKS